MGRKAKIAIILPVHNGTSYLERSIKSIRSHMRRLGEGDYEIIISEDGSTDGTAGLLERIRASQNGILVLSSKTRLGKGAAIELACKNTKAEKIVYFDADLATQLEALAGLIRLLDDNDVVIGSRYASGAKANRKPLRWALSFCYLKLINLLFGANITDYQCGFKAYRRDVFLDVSRKVKDKWWFWDTEFLLEALDAGKKICEVPVFWDEQKDTTFSIFKDTKNMAVALAKYRLRKSGFFPGNADNACANGN